jgi:hypothetical protein
MKHVLFVFLLAMFVAPLINAQDGPYRFAKEIPIPGDGAFDYLSVDPAAHRIYLAVPDFEPLAPGQTGRPKAIPGTFRVLVYEMRAGSAAR